MIPKRPGPILAVRTLFRYMIQKPTREVEVQLDYEVIRIQQRGEGALAEYCLRIGTSSDVRYVPLTLAQMEALLNELTNFIEARQ